MNIAPKTAIPANHKCARQSRQRFICTRAPGTVIKDDDGQILYDLTEGQEVVLCKGGIGGKGNVFYKSSVNQAPEVAQKGMPGTEMHIHSS